MLSARFLGACLLLVSVTWPAQALPLGEYSQQTQQHVKAVVDRFGRAPGRTWGEELALKDLAGIQSALGSVGVLFTDSSSYSTAAMMRVVSDLSAARSRFRNSSSMLNEPEVSAQIQAEVEKLEGRLKKIGDAFSGRALPSQERLAKLDIDVAEGLPYYESPEDLLREARGVRLNLQALRNPGIGRGRGEFSWGTGGTGYDFQALYQAAYDFESTCGSRYQNVIQTRRDFEKLQKAYDRIGPYSYIFDSAGWRDIGRSLERLQRFYATLGSMPLN